MTDHPDTSRDLAWYRSRWEKLMELLSASTPEEVLPEVEALRERNETLEAQRKALAEAGIEGSEQALRMIENMKEQLVDLYDEKEAAERAREKGPVRSSGNTFEQLRRFHALQAKLQRRLGLSSPEDIIEMVENLADQLESLYHRDLQAETTPSSNGASDQSPSSFKHDLEVELGLSDSEAIITMVRNLVHQLDELYSTRERLARLDLDDPEHIVEMVASMQHQLETLYEQQERLSERGLDSVDHALTMVENMEAQLNELYDERRRVAERDFDGIKDAAGHLDELSSRLHTLADQKDDLQEWRSTLEKELDALDLRLDTDDPEAIAQLIRSMEEQLQVLYEDREFYAHPAVYPVTEPLISKRERDQLETRSREELDVLPVGAFCLDQNGIILRANERALNWPGVAVDTPEDLEGVNFFGELGSDVDTSLFREQFMKGRDSDAVDTQFLYQHVGEEPPPTDVALHLHRKPDQTVGWVLFRLQ